MKSRAFCMSVTPFTAAGEIDEAGLRAHLQRMVAADVGVFLASPGSGEGHALTHQELSKVYRIGVEECKGKIPVFANSPEARNATQMKTHMRLAMDAGVDIVQVYPVDAGHGMKPSEQELEQYYRDILDEIDYPLCISVHPLAGGYVTPLKVVIALLKDYKQLVAATVMIDSTYMVALQDAIGPRIAYYNSNRTLSEGLILGTSGALTAHTNIAPRLCQSVFNNFQRGEWDRFQTNYKNVLRLFEIMTRFSGNPLWLKAGLQYMGAPGHGEGRVRGPYLAWPAARRDQLFAALDSMKLREIEASAE